MKPTKQAVLFVTILMLLTFADSTHATMRKTLTPRISIQEQYDDNIHLEPEDEDSDWITLVSPGISLALEGPDTTMNLDYDAGFSYYQDDTDMNSTRHQVGAGWDQDLGEHLRFHLSDTFVRSEDPIVETEGVIVDIRRERRTYYQNTGEASLSYDFGEEDQITGGYRNRYVDDRSISDEDSVGHEGFLTFDKWFTPRYGIAITSGYNRGDFEEEDDEEDDFKQYTAGLSMNYRWQPTRRLYARYDFLYHDFDEQAVADRENDYRVHEWALGINWELSPRTEFGVEGGYWLQDYLHGDSEDGAMFSGTLTTRTQRATFSLAAGCGYVQDYYSAENLGLSKFRQVSGSADYLLTESLRIFGSASHRWNDYYETKEVDRTDDRVWRATGGLSLSFWRWFTLSLEGTHSERDSDDASEEFQDNRVMLRLTGAYPYVF